MRDKTTVERVNAANIANNRPQGAAGGNGNLIRYFTRCREAFNVVLKLETQSLGSILRIYSSIE